MKLLRKLFSKDTGVAFKASFWYTFCNFLQKGISFFVVPLYVRLLTTAEYGQYTTFSSWLSLLIIVASLNLYCGVYTKAMVDLKEDRDRYTSSMQGLGTITTIVLFLVYIANISFWNGFFKINTLVGISMFVYFLAYPSISFWMTRQRVDYKYKKVVFVTLIMSLLYPAISLLLLHTTKLQPKAVMLGYLWSQSLFGLFLYVYYFVKGKLFFDKNYWVKALKFNLPLIPHYVSLVILSQTDRLMVQFYCGDSEAGIYGFACQIGMVLTIVGNAICTSFVPWIYQKLKNKNLDPIKKTFVYLSLFICLCCVVLVAFTPEGIKILGTGEYDKSKFIVPVISFGYFFVFCYSFFANVEFYYSSTKSIMVATTLSALINIGLNALLLPLMGSIAAALTTMFCDFCLCVFHFLASKQVLKKQGILKTPFNIVQVFLIGLFAAVIGLCFILLYGDFRARICFVLTLLIFAFAAKDKIKDIFRGMRNGKKE